MRVSLVKKTKNKKPNKTIPIGKICYFLFLEYDFT